MTLRRVYVIAMVGVALGAAACSDDEPAAPTPEVFTATLTGGAENPAVTTTATGTARVEFTTTGLTYTVTVNGIQNVTLAHIHGPAALATTNAGVILNLNPQLTPPVTTGTLATGTAVGPGTSTAAVSMDSLKVLIRGGLTYVNVHNTANPGGHIRGTLVRSN